MAFRVVHISDTHLSPDAAWFEPNFSAMAAIASTLGPDLVVNTGDLALDGANHESHLAFARQCHERLEAPWLAIPGNHDVGDNPWKAEIPDPINEQRLARYRRHFGDDSWRVDAGDWVLLGVNAQLFDSGLAAEEEQWAFIATVSRTARGRPVALFIHKPLFKDDPGEATVDGRYVPPGSRRRLETALADADVRLVASGHVHQHRQHRVGGVAHSWAPSTAYVLPDRRQPRIGTKHVGYVLYTFGEGTVDIETVEPPELVNHDADQFPEMYRRAKRVLFLCTHNSARSQMAEGLLRAMAGDRFEVASAGTEKTAVRPLATRVMAEAGVDLSGHTSKTLDQFVSQPWDFVITVCDSANESCPVFPAAAKRLHWSFPDPSRATGTEEAQLAVYRDVRDAIKRRLEAWLAGA